MASRGGLAPEYGFLTRVRSEQLRDVGATMTPFNAFLFLTGMETLALRMRQHVENARGVADIIAADEYGVFQHFGEADRGVL